MNLNKVANTISWLSIISAGLLLAVITYWTVYPYKPLVINKSPAKVLTKEVKAGEILAYEVDFCKNTKLSAVITRNFIDGILFTTPSSIGTNEVGCKVNNIVIHTPDELIPGEYYVRISYSYKVNPIRDVVVVLETEKFKIIK